MTMDDQQSPVPGADDAASGPAEAPAGADAPAAPEQPLPPDDPDGVIWEGSASLRLVLPPVAVVAVAYVLVALLQVVFGADSATQTITLVTAVLVALLVGGWFAAVQRAKFYRVTSSSIMARTGVFDKVTEEVDLVHFRDVFVEQSPLGHFLGCGDVEVITGDLASEQVRFAGVRDPLAVRETVLRAVAGSRARTTGTGDVR